MGLSVVSQTRCKIDVFPAFALPITSTRNLNVGNRGLGRGRLSAVRAVWLCAVRRAVRLCELPIGAVGTELLIDRFLQFVGGLTQNTCSSNSGHWLPGLRFPWSAWRCGLRHITSQPQSHYRMWVLDDHFIHLFTINYQSIDDNRTLIRIASVRMNWGVPCDRWPACPPVHTQWYSNIVFWWRDSL